MDNNKIVYFPEDYSSWLESYKINGFIVIKEFFSPDILVKLRKGLSKIIDKLAKKIINVGKASRSNTNLVFEKRLLKLTETCREELPALYRSELHEPEFYSLFSNPKLFSLILKILSNVKEIRIYPNYSSRPKTKNNIHDVTWHQDAALRSDGGPTSISVVKRKKYFGIDAMVNCWMPLIETSSKNGAIKFIPRSFHKIHKHINMGSYLSNFTRTPIKKKEMGLGGETNLAPGTYMTGIPLKIVKTLISQFISIECNPGDVVLFNNLLVHRGGVNNSEKIRWSFDWRYQDAAKSTLRELNGHILYGKNKMKIIQDAEEWLKRSLT